MRAMPVRAGKPSIGRSVGILNPLLGAAAALNQPDLSLGFAGGLSQPVNRAPPVGFSTGFGWQLGTKLSRDIHLTALRGAVDDRHHLIRYGRSLGHCWRRRKPISVWCLGESDLLLPRPVTVVRDNLGSYFFQLLLVNMHLRRRSCGMMHPFRPCTSREVNWKCYLVLLVISWSGLLIYWEQTMNPQTWVSYMPKGLLHPMGLLLWTSLFYSQNLVIILMRPICMILSLDTN